MTSPEPPPSEGDVNVSAARAKWRASLSDRARAALDEDERYFLPPVVADAVPRADPARRGAVLIDVDGRRILDFHGNSVHQLGHGHPKVVAAIRREMDVLPFCPRRYANATATALARRLVETAPGGLDKVLFAPSGSAATSMALKLARYATGRHKTLSLWDSFHGANLDGSASAAKLCSGMGSGRWLRAPSTCRRCISLDRSSASPTTSLTCSRFRATCRAEPMRWTTVEAPPPNFWPTVKEACHRNGALLIFDEIPSCLARIGTLYACEQFGATPDILVIGKGLGGGIMPLAAIFGRSAARLRSGGCGRTPYA